MVLTKTQVINFLQKQKEKASYKSNKYYAIGGLKILVEKDIITVSDIIAEFPELNT